MPKTTLAHLHYGRPGTKVGYSAINDFTRNAALRSIGAVVYAMRLDDGIIKIGHTTDLSTRLKTVAHRSGSTVRDVLAFQAGTVEDEQAIHGLLDGHQAWGREYYYPTRRVLEVVNQMRARLGIQALA